MRAFVVAFLLFLHPVFALAQTAPIAERFYAISQNTDFPGHDIGAIYDTTFDGCRRACTANDACVAFTFNQRNGACFPKTDVSDTEGYEGALSVRMFATDRSILERLDTRLEALNFLRSVDFSAARTQAEGLGQEHYVGTWSLERILDAAQAREAEGETLRAMRLTGAAVTLTDDPALWAEYARLALAVETTNRSERRNLDRRALRAAVNASLRADGGRELSDALLLLSEALEARDRTREMIPALRLALAEAPRPEIENALDSAIRLYGFRVVGNRVDNNAAEPRICVLFSEDLVGGASAMDFLQSQTSGLSVDAEGRQFCLSGVQHGQRYEFSIRAGLPAVSGETLRHPVALRLYVRDRDPAVRFPGRGYVLPRLSAGGLPIVTVNTDEVSLALHTVTDRNIARSLQEEFFGRPLSDWQLDRFIGELAETVWQGTGDVAAQLNQDVTTSLPLGDVLAGLTPGLYALEARIPGPEGRNVPPATQWFFISDIGISSLTGSDGVHVTLRSLTDTTALLGHPVQLISESNRILAEAETDADGYVHFGADITAGRGASSPAMVSVTTDQDFAFLSLRDAEFDLSDRGVEGRPAAPAIDLFLTTERGAYRAGELVHATALARDSQGAALAGLPLTAILTRADGVEYSRVFLDETGAGGFVWQMPLGQNVPRGTWRLSVHADPDDRPLASTSFLVEDFLPERIDVVLDLPDGPVTANLPVQLAVQSDYLFGAPAGDLPIEGSLMLRPVSQLPDYVGYRFGRHDDRPQSRFAAINGDTRTDATGLAELALALPEVSGPPHPYDLTITAAVTEGSGRPVERQITRMVSPTGTLIGIRPLFDGTLPEGSDAAFHLIAVGAEALPVRWTVNRVDRRYQWYTQNGRWNWEPITTRTQILTGEAVIGSDPLEISAPVTWGRYELRVESIAGDFTISSLGFRSGWYGSDESAGTPDLLELSLDADEYSVGEQAQLRIVPRHGGTALIRVVANRMIHQEVVELGDTPTNIPLAVTEDWGTGAYVTATLLRPLQALPPQVPARSIGLVHAAINPGDRHLDLVLQAPLEAAPRDEMDVTLHVGNTAPGETVYASIALVDVGILNLTGFEAPDPQSHYFGQRRLGMGMRDLYGRLIESGGVPGQIRQGGDATAGMRMQAPPPTEALVAFHSGPLTVGDDGTVTTTFELPAFNGTVRVMAIAWSETGIGQAEADVLVRDPVVVTASLPRFMAPGDTARLLLEVTHADGPTGPMPIEISLSDGLSLGGAIQAVDLEEGETEQLSLQLIALQDEGPQEVTVTLITPDGQRLSRNLHLLVQANDPVQATTSRITLAAGESLSLTPDLFAGLRPGQARATVSVGAFGRFDAPGLLAMLDRYPYGCSEQMASRAMPLLYMADVAETLGLATSGAFDLRIQRAVDDILVNQAANGGFGLWGAYSGDAWLNAYVTDFLSRARAEGYDVADQAFQSALDNLRNHIATAPDFERGGQSIAYALYVLAREGAAAIGDLRYYADVKSEAFATPLALAQLGAALALYGDQPRADAMFLAGYALLVEQTQTAENTGFRSDFGSHRRDAMGLLTLASAAGSNVVPIAEMAQSLPTPTTNLSTQEAMWSLLAAHQLVEGNDLQTLILSDGAESGPMPLVLSYLGRADRVITNTGDRPETLTLTRFGQPEGATEASGQGYSLTRRYLTLEGVPADPSTVPIGTRLVAVLTVTPFEDRRARLMVNDPLPAGFEIDNPNLLRSGDIGALQDLDLFNAAEHVEFRQDRFLAAVDQVNANQIRLAYIVRAVTPGGFHHPAASVEDMYRPAFRAQTASGQVVVTE